MTPLVALLRPQTLPEFIGQKKLVGPNLPLAQALKSGHLFSMIFWEPRGSGKTTLAHIIANTLEAHFIAISAVMAG